MTAEATTTTKTPREKELENVVEKSTSLQQGEKKAFPVPRKKFSTGELMLAQQELQAKRKDVAIHLSQEGPHIIVACLEKK